MILGLRTVIYHTPDLARAKAWYSNVLERSPYFEEPFYVGFEVGGFELGLLPDPGLPTGPGGQQAYWGVADLTTEATRLASLGAVPVAPIADVGGGIRHIEFLDPFGNRFGLIENPHFQLAKAQ